MVFSSLIFLFAFLPVALCATWLAPRRLRNATLLAFSLLFYAWGSGPVVLGLAGLSVACWWLGLRAHAGAPGSGQRKLAVAGALALSLGVLGYFKYSNFFVGEISAAVVALGGSPIGWVDVALPIGISFYSFQAMSYVVDVARGDTEPERNLVDFALYLALFPQLIAGPIVRYRQVAKQLHERALTLGDFASGAVRFAHGLVKKVVVADAVGPVVDAVFGGPDAEVGTAAAWLGVAAYHLQLYFDFSGYSDMAIGLGRMLGFRLPENFDRPLSSVSFTDFWRRWHMTMSTWFRDYLYFPMGGASRSRARNAFNLVTVFLAVGLWHGADWTFVAFGAYHGTVIVIERALRAREDTHRALRRAFTTFLLLMGWPLFRGDSLAHAGALWADLFRFDTAPLPVDLQLALTNRTVLVFALASLVVLLPTKVKAGTFLMSGRGPWVAPARLATMVAMFYAGLLVVSGTYSPFLYFQF